MCPPQGLSAASSDGDACADVSPTPLWFPCTTGILRQAILVFREMHHAVKQKHFDAAWGAAPPV